MFRGFRLSVDGSRAWVFMKVRGVQGAAEFAFAWGFVKLGIWAITWGLNTPETLRPETLL